MAAFTVTKAPGFCMAGDRTSKFYSLSGSMPIALSLAAMRSAESIISGFISLLSGRQHF
ncbi:MAG: hypothetical protein U7126_21050 [Microcoleus sp.]